jgi:hypothetical protein
MSAFMVADTTINRVVTFVEWKLLHDWPMLAEKFGRFGFDVHDATFSKKLGEAMFVINIRGVNARYGENEAQSFRPLNYKYHAERAEAIQVYKSIGCWLYQCLEGDVPEDPFYKLMQEVEHALAHHIVCRLPEYDNAEWG